MAVYAMAIFTGAFLLFQVQPMMGRYLLPWFGGGAGVWTTCLVFFQVVLLGGYAYAYASARFLKPRWQVLVHLLLVAAAFALLPITPNEAWKLHASSDPTLSILSLLAVSVGLPYFALSATAPLVQHWLGHTHPSAPAFRLYALSNAGSLLALLSYPTWFETTFTRRTQAHLWVFGLCCYAVECCLCARTVWRASALTRAASIRGQGLGGPAPSSRTRIAAADPLLWVLLPACASLLLLAVTNEMCQEVAVVPLLWVLPLTVYLLSFIICFERPQWYRRRWAGPALLATMILMGCLVTRAVTWSVPLQLGVLATGLLVCCLVCHGELYRLRPESGSRVTFYLFLAAGGALGGVFVALIAPLIFSDYFELHWGLVGCGLLFLAVWARKLMAEHLPLRSTVAWCLAGLVVVALGSFLWRHAHRFAGGRIYRSRSFYGVLKVYRHEQADPQLNLVELVHGRVAHGVQFSDPRHASIPTLYYNPSSGIGQAFQVLPPGPRRIGVVGLGVGTIAAYGRSGDEIRFYEINPDVEHLARTQFTYLSNSQANTTVALGDARWLLEHEPPQNFDLLALDAFNSDSIPTHLLTREAFDVYARHLRTNGVLAIHVSNASLDLEPVVARLAQDRGYQGVVIAQPESDEARGLLPSTWILLSPTPDRLSLLARGGEARPLVASKRAPLWTDDFSGLFAVLRWQEFLNPKPAGRPQPVWRTAASAKPGRLAPLLERYRQALKQDPNSSVALNNLACLLAMAPDPALRDGLKAVRLAERAAALTQFRNPSVLSTLAAAYAEAGRFDEAIATAERARALAAQAGQTGLVEGNLHMLELFRKQRPYHNALTTEP